MEVKGNKAMNNKLKTRPQFTIKLGSHC